MPSLSVGDRSTHPSWNCQKYETNGTGGVGNGFYFGFAGGGAGAGTLTFNSPATSTTGYFHLSNANTVVTGGGVYNLAADANNTPQPASTVEPPRSALMVGLTGGVTNSTFMLTGGTTINAADNVYFGAVVGNTTNAIIRGAGTVLMAA